MMTKEAVHADMTTATRLATYTAMVKLAGAVPNIRMNTTMKNVAAALNTRMNTIMKSAGSVLNIHTNIIMKNVDAVPNIRMNTIMKSVVAVQNIHMNIIMMAAAAEKNMNTVITFPDIRQIASAKSAIPMRIIVMYAAKVWKIVLAKCLMPAG